MRAKDGRTVFLVHGRDDAAREALTALLEAFDLRVMPWREAAALAGGGTPYTWDIVKAGMDQADAVVVLLTPDDEGRLREPFRQHRDGPDERDLTGQPRMNVVFEAGLAMGIDRSRVVLVEVGQVRPMSDIAGINLIRMNDSVERRRDLAARLRGAGLAVNMEHGTWWEAGSFTTAALPPTTSRGPDRAPAPDPVPAARNRGSKGDAYLEFWTRFLATAAQDERTRAWLRARTPSRDNYAVMESGPKRAYVVSFGFGNRLRAEVYLDGPDAEANQRLFDEFFRRRGLLQSAFGATVLSWEPLPGKRACRIAAYAAGTVLNTVDHGEYVEWFIATISRLRATFEATPALG